MPDKDTNVDNEENEKNKKAEAKPEKTENIEDPEEIEEIIDHLPEDEEKEVLKSLMISKSSMTSSPFPPQVLENLNEKHIDKVLEISSDSEERDFEMEKTKERNKLLYVVIGVVVFIFLTVFLAKEETQLFLDVLKVSFGFLGGWGAGTYKRNQG